MQEEARVNRPLTVTELTQSIKLHLEKKFAFISVQGEISNLREQASGHIYFTLKDAAAQLSAVLFKGQAQRLSSLPKNGDQVILRGEINVYPPKGGYQLVVRELEKLGLGELLKKFHELKEKLGALGWFEQQYKKPLPRLPKTIGVVTSPTGAVIQDIIHILSRRFPGFHLLLNPVRVQGEEAKFEIAKAIEQFNLYACADVLIVGRGGGSLEDLWPFNEEVVAQAIKNSKIPIISAVGHETDFSLSDFVADVRAPTPSAAAEIVTIEKQEHLLYLSKTRQRLKANLLNQIHFLRKRLMLIQKQPAVSSPDSLLAPYVQRMDDIKQDMQTTISYFFERKRQLLQALNQKKLALKPGSHIPILKQNLQKMRRNLSFRCEQLIAEKERKLVSLTAHLKSIDPRNLFTKGYAILFRENSPSVILSTSEVKAEEKVRILMQGGELSAKILDKK